MFSSSSVFNHFRISELPEADWGKQQIKQPVATVRKSHDLRDPNHIPQPQYGQFEPLSRTQEIPRGKIDFVRASIDSLPSYSSKGSGHSHNPDLHSNRNQGVRDSVNSDYHSNKDEKAGTKADFHGNLYPATHTGDPQGQGNRPLTQTDTQAAFIDRKSILRQSIEDFSKYKEAYQGQQNFEGHQGHYYGNAEYPYNMQVHQHYHQAEQPYDQAHYYHSHDQVHQGHQQGYDQGLYHGDHLDNHHPDAHHHFQNIYSDRPYHTMGERGETEGGNVDLRYYHHGYGPIPQHGYHGNNNMPHNNQRTEGVIRDQNVYAKTVDKENSDGSVNTERSANVGGNSATNTSIVSTGSGRKLPQVKYRLQNIASTDSTKDSQRTQSGVNSKKGAGKSVKEKMGESGYKVKYDRDGGGQHAGTKKQENMDEQEIERDFIEQGNKTCLKLK